MEFPPPGWELYQAKDFNTDIPHIEGDHVMELKAQARPNGRVVDHWRVGIGGAKILEANIRLKEICKSSAIAPYRLVFQAWPRDVNIRRNMTSSPWLDGMELLERREYAIWKDGEKVTIKEDVMLGDLEKEVDQAKKSFSIRFAVGVADDKTLRLELQGLPATESTLKGKPAFVG
jgi:hypothetical protein